MKNKKKVKISHLLIVILVVVFIGFLIHITNALDDKIKKNKDNSSTIATDLDAKSKNEVDVENIQNNEMLDYDEDRVWFNDDNYVLSNFLPLSGNALKSEMLTRYLRSNGYAEVESVTVIDNSLKAEGNKYIFSCKIDNTKDTINITWDSYEGVFTYFIKAC